MDDCTLEKLAVKPGKLTPSFQKSHLEYDVTVPSNVEKIHIDPLTSDSGASYCIFVSELNWFVLKRTRKGWTKQVTAISCETSYVNVKMGSVSELLLDPIGTAEFTQRWQSTY